MKKQKNVFIKLKKLALIMSIGVLFSSGMPYYPTQNFEVIDGLLGYSVSRTLIEHAEINEMFYNNFIPAGLFYDLMDANPNPFLPFRVETYDRISGYTTQQIFDLMRWDVPSMQEYKIRFERRYGSNINTQNLFRRYGL